MVIIEELALPLVKIHCSVLVEDAVKDAITDYTKKNGVPYLCNITLEFSCGLKGKGFFFNNPNAAKHAEVERILIGTISDRI